MSLAIDGTLTVKSISGAKGSFCVGDLLTDVGAFRVKDALLDEFDAGQYTGRFVIGAIYPASYTWRGKVFVEVRARLEAIHLADVSDVVPGDTEQDSEPDPIHEPISGPSLPAPLSMAQVDEPSSTSLEPSASPLFDAETLSLVEQGGPVKLDPAGIDRAVFRQQRDALKTQGFRFVAASQHWIRDLSQ